MSGANIMWCEYHNDAVDWERFEYKGCWGCHYFSGLDTEKYIYVSEAAELLGVSERTVRRWIQKNILNGDLYTRIRPMFISSAPKVYVIERESVNKVLEKRG